MRFKLLAAVMAVGLMASQVAGAATSRGVQVTLKASEKPNAPVVETVQLYGASHALVIGIDAYTGGWPRLRNAVKDARVVAQELKRKGFQVTIKTDLKANALRSTLREFFAIKGADPDARLLLWYAGHGHTVNGEGFLVPADAPAVTDPMFLVSALPMRDFGSLVRLAQSKHVLSIFDSCFSGTVFEARAGAISAAITKKTTKPVRQFITSGDAGQQVRDDGSFREYFVRALRGEERADFNNDGYVTGEELGLFLNQRVTALTSAAQTPKSGKLHDVRFNQGDFVFALPGGARPSASSDARPSGENMELAFWQSIQGSKNPADFEAYVRQFPNGTFAALARNRVKDLKERQVASLPPTAAPSLAPTKDQIRETQRLLTALGYSPGPSDGIMGRGTRTAIELFQRQVGLPADGMVSGGLLDSLRKARPQVSSVRPAPVPARPARLVQLVNFFDQVVFGSQISAAKASKTVVRWTKERVQVIVKESVSKKTVQKIHDHLKILKSLTGLKFQLSGGPKYKIKRGDIDVHFVRRADMRNPNVIGMKASVVATFPATKSCYFVTGRNQLAGQIVKGIVVINREMDQFSIDHCIVAQITKVLGFPGIGKTEVLRPSLFHRDKLLEPGRADQIIIRALYDPRLEKGLPRGKALKVVKDIIADLHLVTP
jgi:hypothetical protein